MSEHEHEHGGVKPPGRDAADWDARYAESDRLWSPEPNPTIAQIVGPLSPGGSTERSKGSPGSPAPAALDFGAGEGRHAVWLAALGWDVTAVDFSRVGIDKGRREAESRGIDVDWHVADARDWSPPAGTTYALVLVVFLHLEADVLARTRDWLAPGGRLVVLGHARRNLTEGVGGPQDPRLLHTEEQLRAAARGLRIERLEEVLRPTPHGDAIDVTLVACRESAAAPATGQE
jgi:SAM-dependent methyltransferase